MKLPVVLSVALVGVVAVPMSDEDREEYEKKIYECTNHNPEICTREFKWYETSFRPDYLWRCPPLDRTTSCSVRWRTVCFPDDEGRCWCKKLIPENYVSCPDGCRQTTENFPYCHCPDLSDCVDPGFLGLFRKNCGYMKGKCYCEAKCRSHYTVGAIDNHYTGSD